MPTLTKQQEDRFRVSLFKTRYKILIGHGLSEDERFFQAIYDTSDEKLNPDDYPEIVEEWLMTFYGRKARKRCQNEVSDRRTGKSASQGPKVGPESHNSALETEHKVDEEAS